MDRRRPCPHAATSKLVAVVASAIAIAFPLAAAAAPGRTDGPCEDQRPGAPGVEAQAAGVGASARAAACRQHVERHRCDQLRDALPESARRRAISSETCEREPERAENWVAASCAQGGWNFFVHAYQGARSVLQSLPGPRACDVDADQRRAVVAHLRGLVPDAALDGVVASRAPCADLQRWTSLRTESLLRRIEAKAETGGTERDPLTLDELRFLASQGEDRARALSRAWEEIAQRYACYSAEAKVEFLCEALTGAAVGAGAAAVGARAARAVAASDFVRVRAAQETVGRALSEAERAAVIQAHRVGAGEIGRDGGLARSGQYTREQLRRKAEILRDAGFSRVERRELMRHEIVGESAALVGAADAAGPAAGPAPGAPNPYAGARTHVARESAYDYEGFRIRLDSGREVSLPRVTYTLDQVELGQTRSVAAGSRVALPEGRYNYVIHPDGAATFGQVENAMETGVKHFQLAQGRPVIAAGEIRVRSDGRYVFNLSSGTFSRELARGGVNPTTLEGRAQRALRGLLGDSGELARGSFPKGGLPTLDDLIRWCRTRSFAAANAALCRPALEP